MKKIKWFVLPGIFLYLFIFGAQMGKIIADGQQAYRSAQNEVIFELPDPPPHPMQFSVLILLVDDLNQTEFRLEGAWLGLWAQELEKITMMSLYPVTAAPQLIKYQNPHAPILLTRGQINSLNSLDIFNVQQIQWDAVIFIDEIGLERVIEITSNQQIFTDQSVETQPNAEFPKTWETPEQALVFQEGLMQFICMHTDSFSQIQNVNIIFESLGTHLYSDISSEDQNRIWNDFRMKDFKIDCKFPYQQSISLNK